MSLLSHVEGCCDSLLRDPALAPLHEIVRRERERLHEPLRVAVCGALSAGKSTLVNALVGRTVAATGRAETTETNWWFRAGSPEYVSVRRPDGGWAEAPLRALADGVPGPVDLDAVDAIEVRLDSPLLRDLTVIDTPGLFTPNAERSRRTEALIRDRTLRATALADALIYVTSELPGAARDDERLREFQALFGSVSRAPTNSLLVLSKADRWWAPREARTPLEIGYELLSAHRDELRHRVWEALPMVGLLAAAPQLDEDAVTDLRSLAGSPDRHLIRLGRAMLMRAGSDVVPERRAALHDALGAYGLELALTLAAGGADAGAIRAALVDASGIAEVRRMIEGTLCRRSEVLRADALLVRLERLALARPDGLGADAAARLRGEIEALRTRPRGAELHALDALRRAADRDLPLSPGQRAELRRLFGAGSWTERLGPLPDGVGPQEVALRRRDVWRSVENRRPAPLGLRRLGAEARLAYEDVLAEASRGG